MKSFIKFPRTSHIYDGRNYRNDLQLTESDTIDFFSKPIIVQEKLDGTNVGLRFHDSNLLSQTRGQYLSDDDNFYKKLFQWCSIHYDELLTVLGEDKILFGEWMLNKHSIYYDKLPSFFMVFDVFDVSNEKFYSQKRVNDLLSGTSIKQMPILHEGIINLDGLHEFIGQSSFGSEVMEGIYLRHDSNDYNEDRCKYVRPDFTQGITEHWKNQPRVLNKSLDELEKYWSF